MQGWIGYAVPLAAAPGNGAGAGQRISRRGPSRLVCRADLGAIQIEVHMPARRLARELATLFPIQATGPSQERPPHPAPKPASVVASASPMAPPRLWVRRTTRRTPCVLCGARAPARDSFLILRDDGMARVACHACELLSCLEWQVSDLAQHTLPAQGYLLVHAAVLVRHGHALLLPAASGSGKSTLAAALALTGWRYWSDEFAVLDLAAGVVLPYRKAITLRAGGAEALHQFAAAHTPLGQLAQHVGHQAMRFNGEQLRFWLPPQPADNGAAARPAWLALPMFEPGAEPALEPLKASVTLEALLLHSLSRGAELGRRLPRLVEIVRPLVGARLRYADLAQAVSLLDRLCGSAGDVQSAGPAADPMSKGALP
jgi:hypothetical protein